MKDVLKKEIKTIETKASAKDRIQHHLNGI